mmetsp:Transcript_44458/g.128480  ORF Transcript_44458/g.128480 Transcript_44458/m.128480 type:complete len:267 (-) Transcript_44458:930-1730(-)
MVPRQGAAGRPRVPPHAPRLRLRRVRRGEAGRGGQRGGAGPCRATLRGALLRRHALLALQPHHAAARPLSRCLLAPPGLAGAAARRRHGRDLRHGRGRGGAASGRRGGPRGRGGGGARLFVEEGQGAEGPERRRAGGARRGAAEEGEATRRVGRGAGALRDCGEHSHLRRAPRVAPPAGGERCRGRGAGGGGARGHHLRDRAGARLAAEAPAVGLPVERDEVQGGGVRPLRRRRGLHHRAVEPQAPGHGRPRADRLHRRPASGGQR